LWVIELGCSHFNSEHTNIGNLVERFRCVDCAFEYEVDHGD
jgi:transposase-like protein